MFETAFTLGLTQFARTFSFPERIQHRPARNAALELLRLRNTGFDAMFYDVKSLTAEETFYISDCLGSEGLIIIVPPTGGGMLTLCESVGEFRLRGGKNVHALAVAGIGGSALGAAAFARNVADAIKAPVAAVVSGYGLGDVVNEAIGGAFFFGWLGQMRNSLQAIDDAVGRPKLGAYDKRQKRANETARTGLDADTVETLLSDPSLSFTLLTGHSRGNRVLADALYAMKAENPEALKAVAKSSRVVTFGGRIKMPEVFTDVIDVVGELDWFGEINSRPQIPSDLRVPYCGHSTNTDIAGSLRVTSILKDILAKEPQAKPTTEVETAKTADVPPPAPVTIPSPVVDPQPVVLPIKRATATIDTKVDAKAPATPAPSTSTGDLAEIGAEKPAEQAPVSDASEKPMEKAVEEAIIETDKAPAKLEANVAESASVIAEESLPPQKKVDKDVAQKAAKKTPAAKTATKSEATPAKTEPAAETPPPKKAAAPARVTSMASVAGKKRKAPQRKGRNSQNS